MAPALNPADSALTAEIARTYDAMVYDPVPDPALELASLRGAVAASGFAVAPGPALDVLDIGCGAGGMLLRAAGHSPGRMVGIDAAAAGCAIATARGAPFGERWRIIQADAASIDPRDLGGFDVIHLVGTLFIAAPSARAAMLGLVATCLNPGGVAVITGYTGLYGLSRIRLGRLLRAEANPALPIAEQVAQARKTLAALAATLPAGMVRDLAHTTLAGMSAAPDIALFHEALGPVYEALHTGDLEAALAPHGLVFANYLAPAPLRRGATSRDAAHAADAWDFVGGGGYRSILFTRALPGAPPIHPRDPRLAWTTAARRQHAAEPDGTVAYRDPRTGNGLRTASPLVQAMLDGMAEAPRDFATLCALTGPDPAGAAEEVAQTLGALWSGHIARPLWTG